MTACERIRAARQAQEARPQVGDVWQDEDRHLLRVVHVEDSGWFWVKPYRSPNASSIYTNPAWLTRWTLTEFGK